MSPKSYRRGYPVAVLVGIEQNHAALWQVFSQVAKHQQNIALNGDRNDPKALYNFHESIINAIRPILKEGIRSIIVASPSKTRLCTTIPKPHQRASQLACFKDQAKQFFQR